MELKVFYDDLVEKNTRLKNVVDQINELAKAGDKKAALEMREELNIAREEAMQADAIYVEMVEASHVYETGAAREFVPVSKTKTAENKEMKRDEYEALDPVERGKFLTGGGKIVD